MAKQHVSRESAFPAYVASASCPPATHRDCRQISQPLLLFHCRRAAFSPRESKPKLLLFGRRKRCAGDAPATASTAMHASACFTSGALPSASVSSTPSCAVCGASTPPRQARTAPRRTRRASRILASRDRRVGPMVKTTRPAPVVEEVVDEPEAEPEAEPEEKKAEAVSEDKAAPRRRVDTGGVKGQVLRELRSKEKGRVSARTNEAGTDVGRAREEKPPRTKIGRRPAALREPFQAYMDEISRSDVLDHASVIALASKIKEGAKVEKAQDFLRSRNDGVRPTLPDLAEHMGLSPPEVQHTLNRGVVAKNDLVAANLRLVTSVAHKIQNTKSGTAGLALDDMIQEGNVGLIRAAEKYDGSKGYRFSTYATWWVRASILRAITTQSRAIKVPSTVVEDHSRIVKERAKQIAAGVLDPKDEEVAAALGITTAKLRFVSSVVTRMTASLDINVGSAGDAGSSTLGQLIPGDDDIEERMVEEMQRKELDVVLRKNLKPMERAAIRLRFGLEDGHPRTLLEVGTLLSISKERVRQHVFAALSKLKTPEVKEFLVGYLS